VRDLKEPVEFVKARKGRSYASRGVGSGGHRMTESLDEAQAGITGSPHVPYETVAQIPTDEISGVMPIATLDVGAPLPHIESGRLRAIGTVWLERPLQRPEVRTTGEQGFELDTIPWYGLS
jgi:tripartite-type tricarboxylate transporter receptor subunit TctC